MESYYLGKIQDILNRVKVENRTLLMEEFGELKSLLSTIILCKNGITQIWLPDVIIEVAREINKYNLNVDKNGKERFGF